MTIQFTTHRSRVASAVGVTALAWAVAIGTVSVANGATKAPTGNGGWGDRSSWDSHFTDGNIFDDHGGRDWNLNDGEEGFSKCSKRVRLPGHGFSGIGDCKRAEAPKKSPRPKPKPPVFEKPKSPFEPKPKEPNGDEDSIVDTPAAIPGPMALPLLATAFAPLICLRRRKRG